MPMQKVLEGCEPLQRLRLRLAQSQARVDAVRAHLPPALRPWVTGGPVDDEGWTLLAANPAVAAKLRQLLPRLEEALRQQGCERSSIRIRVQPGTLPGR